MRILIVEDDFLSRWLLQKILSQYGEVTIAVNGEEAISAFKLSHQEKNLFDLVCLDIMLPLKDGQEVLKEMRQFEEEQGISRANWVKIIIITALGDPKNLMTAFRYQCDGYLVKPIDQRKLVEEMTILKVI